MGKDMVNHPSHYTQGAVECIEAIKASMTPIEFCGYLKGTAMKYLWRYRNKGKVVEDLEKSNWFSERLLKEVKEMELAKVDNQGEIVVENEN